MDQIVLRLSEEEVKMVVAALNSVPVQGVQAMQKVLALVLKIQRSAEEQPVDANVS